MFTRLVIVFALSGPLLAQDGAQLYTTYCSVCHGLEGTGAAGTFPPLAESPWIKGDGDRAIKVVLHGLEGPVNVIGKIYNLAMPPQGEVLPDENIAAILTFVRSSWGNTESAISKDQVKAIRAATTDRKKAWSGEEILKDHPLPLEATALKNLISSVYSGIWEDFPNFSTLKADNIEEEHNGIISTKQAGKTENFGIVWQADFDAPVDGEYTFLLDANDAARLIVKDKVIAEVLGTGFMDGTRDQQGEIELVKGINPVRIEYHQTTGNQGIVVGWKGPDMKKWEWVSEEKQNAGPGYPVIQIKPTTRPVLYRNFIEGTTTRNIAVGFPGGVNLAYSIDHFAPELMWTGLFMDGGRHYSERGMGNSAPAGENLVKVSENLALPKGSIFQGYKLDSSGNPTFSVKVGTAILFDGWLPQTRGFSRKLSLTGSGEPVEIVLSDLFSGAPNPEGEFLLGDQILLTADGQKPSVTDQKVTLKLNPGESTTLTYLWK